jgi:hypothetical protein
MVETSPTMYNLCFYHVGNVFVHVWYSPAEEYLCKKHCPSCDIRLNKLRKKWYLRGLISKVIRKLLLLKFLSVAHSLLLLHWGKFIIEFWQVLCEEIIWCWCTCYNHLNTIIYYWKDSSSWKNVNSIWELNFFLIFLLSYLKTHKPGRSMFRWGSRLPPEQ